ncbi:hypothetical protein JDV02_007346 [Purpureocillium takamizusanense]|uniref:Aminoglycoside phosphotransferase domain-containing protein n=1 Tax=Purpureocillium takamizusanense TaxID=2060973 RepID=A0A9Q8VC86_9HYPO|nr:uncharacterized protein JDV02_007346 [Purpureocillium takamizusanense]UNI21350.1 hypothetical protein JDV02_007346 [Purpureocillium takamizusanense]
MSGEAHGLASADETLRCEAATYLWLQERCPDIPIPKLHGFGLPCLQSFTALENVPFWNRLAWQIRRILAWFRGRTLPRYFSHRRRHLAGLGYLLLEYVEEGEMLSSSWQRRRDDPKRRANLFRGLSRVMVRLAKLPLPRIGSWTIDDEGVLSLTNRPLSIHVHMIENAGISSGIPRDRTYTSTEQYVLDLLACQDNRIRDQPNSIHNVEDGYEQLAALTSLRACLPTFTRGSRDGLFALSLTDPSRDNIFVDQDWNVTKIIDLEWACVLPVEMTSPPSWLSSQHLDEVALEPDDYVQVVQEFFEASAAEERSRYQTDSFTRTMQDAWRTGSFWYTHAVSSPSLVAAIFPYRIQPLFAKPRGSDGASFESVVAPLWDRDVPQFIAEKLAEKARYAERLRELFAVATAPSEGESTCNAGDGSQNEQ